MQQAIRSLLESEREIDDQELRVHEQAVSDVGPRTAGPKECGDRG